LLSSAAAAADVKTFQKTVPLDPAGRFSLDTYKGLIRVTGWDRPQAEIDARIVADPFSWFSSSVDDAEIRVDNSPGDVRVRTVYRQHGSFFEGNTPSVEYTIHVPRRASLSIKDYKSDSEIAGVEGGVELTTYKGTAHMNGLRGALRVNTYKGEIRAAFSSFTAGSSVETYRGEIDLSLPAKSAFDIHAKLERHASFDSAFPRTIRSSTHRNDFQSSVNGGGPALRLSSYRGNIRLHSTN
jgi:hypothetical protein